MFCDTFFYYVAVRFLGVCLILYMGKKSRACRPVLVCLTRKKKNKKKMKFPIDIVLQKNAIIRAYKTGSWVVVSRIMRHTIPKQNNERWYICLSSMSATSFI